MITALPPLWLYRWLCGPDTGASSITIAHVLSGGAVALPHDYAAAPLDFGDLGRCLRLLYAAEANGEAWRARLPEVAQRYPVWAPLVAIWPELEAAGWADLADFAALGRRPSGGRKGSSGHWDLVEWDARYPSRTRCILDGIRQSRRTKVGVE